MRIQTHPSFNEESTAWGNGYSYVIGIDEVGRGAFAGPIVAASVIFRPETSLSSFEFISKINDSKLLKHTERKILSKLIIENCLSYSIAQVDVNYINKYGIGSANQAVFRKVISSVVSQVIKSDKTAKFYILVDGFHVKFVKETDTMSQKAIIKGDTKSISIAAASIVAKNYRDNLMFDLSKKYPEYLWEENKGYGTKKHREVLKNIGASNLHRREFVRKFI